MKRVLCVVIALSITIIVSAKVYRVNNTPGVNADFTTFNQAHNAASVGDTLMFEGSTLNYNTNDVDTLKKALTIMGPGYFLQENYPSKDDYFTAKINTLFIAASAEGAVVTGMEFNDYSSAIYIDANNVIIDRNYCAGDVVLAQTAPINNVIISRNIVFSQLRSGSNYSDKASINSLIINNILRSRSGVGCLNLNNHSTATLLNNYIGCISDASNCTFKNNLISWVSSWEEGNSYKYNVFGDELPESGVSNILHSEFTSGLFIQDQQFTEINIDNEFQIASSSVAVGAGENGIDCGPFGGTNPYVLSGLPAVPVITEVTMPQSITTELNITIKAKAQE